MPTEQVGIFFWGVSASSGKENALKGQQAHSPGQSAATPWVMWSVVTYAL